MKLFFLLAIATNLVATVPVEIHKDDLPAHTIANSIKLNVPQRLDAVPEIPPTIPCWVKEDIFVADIPYPTQFLKLPVPTSPPRPKSPIDSITDSTIETESETLSSIKKRNINEEHSSLQKRGIAKFLWTNKFAIISGAGLVGGGLYIWNKHMKKRAEQQLKKAMAPSRPEVRATVKNTMANDPCYVNTRRGCAAANAAQTAKAIKTETDQEFSGPVTSSSTTEDNSAERSEIET